MKKLSTLSFICLFLFVFTLGTIAQTPQTIERTLIKNIKEVQKYSDYGSGYDEEKLSAANEVFEANLLKYAKNAATLSYKFPALNKEMFIADSADGKFRIYSWDTETGGTMHDYGRIYQYLGADGKVYAKPEEQSEDEADVGGAGSFVYDIFTASGKAGKIYVVCSTFIGDTQDHSDSADLYKIEGAELKDKIKLIKTGEGLTDTIHFEYNPFSLSDRKENIVKLINFEPKTQTLKIPVVIEDKEYGNGRVTNKFISYRFNGTNFVKVN